MKRDEVLAAISNRLKGMAFNSDDWLSIINAEAKPTNMGRPVTTEFMFGAAVRHHLRYLSGKEFGGLPRQAFSLVSQVGQLTIYWIEDQDGDIVYHERSPSGAIVLPQSVP